MATTAISNISDVVSLVTSAAVVGQSSHWSVTNNGTDNSVKHTGPTSNSSTGIIANSTTPAWWNFNPTDEETSSEIMSPKDQTMFVALIIMGVVVPAIFVFSFCMIFWRRYKQQRERRSQMLLQNSQEVPMDTIPYNMQARLEAGIL